MNANYHLRSVLACVLAVGSFSAFVHADEDLYQSKVKPLLRGRCYACHGALKQEGGLRLDTAELIKKGGDSGSPIDIHAAPESNYLIERVADKDPGYRMPPEFEGEPLTDEEVAVLKEWISQGAPAPDGETPEQDPRQHWAFLPVEKPELPKVNRPGWSENPIDVWIAHGHEQQGFTPQEPVDRIQLLRRVTYDLIGMPPTAEEMAACLEDPSADWYAKTVDRLLADPRHGERWARHWMDVWRYSDWWGLNAQLRNSQRHMWHWRDWIVESLNDDLSYDEMVRLMLAADELTPGDPDKLRATGFLARNYYIFNRVRWMDETVEHVGKGLLGLTMNCAKCHDHKFDPIDQVDYYRMRAFFEPYMVRQDMVPGQVDTKANGIPRAFDALLDEPTYLLVRGDEAQPDKSKVIQPGVPEILEFTELQIEEVSLPPVASQPARQPWVLENYLKAARQELDAAEKSYESAAQALRKARSTASPEKTELVSTEKRSSGFKPVKDAFESLDSSRWKTLSGRWQIEADGIRQYEDGPQRSVLQLTQDVPQDFDATLRFRLHGGSNWRSVGIAFDAPVDGSGQPRYLVYTSGHTRDQKLQAAFDDGAWNYPGNGRKAITLDLETDYTLRVQARGTLLNLYLNGERLLAWRSPVARKSGLLQLVTFDALATFVEFEVKELSADAELFESGSSSQKVVDPVIAAQRDLTIAEAKRNRAAANLKSVAARAEAMRASWEDEQSSEASEKAQEAVQAERELALAEADVALVEAQLELEQADAKGKEAAEKKVQKAEKAVTQAEAELKKTAEDARFTPFAGAKWSATRFQHTGRDDPQLTFPQKSSGRRTALAEWITDSRNPLTARVAVNHIWNRHFGQPLVPTTFDFGRNGGDPVHVELLNWLAADFMEHDWSMKHLHRQIVLSQTYRMGSSPVGKVTERASDPDNQFWWRRIPIRLESQAVRDSVLALAGTLDETLGGPSVPPAEQDMSRRRSLYFFHSNNERNLFLTTFDEASVAECYQREQSVVPQQALALSNSRLVLESAGKIAERLTAEIDKSQAESDQKFIQQAFLQLLGFEAEPEEVAGCLAALKNWENLPDGSRQSARSNLIWTLLNHNDFVTLR
ncbi:MAG: DUF1553 domain-containing protein [Rubinisphaera brasiliensis]|uniref:DUF1553 domain-containing protein n=1 Tax=Rubinisphaera brasiliensis TaxID=119 RepID=UPI0039198788